MGGRGSWDRTGGEGEGIEARKEGAEWWVYVGQEGMVKGEEGEGGGEMRE